MEKDVTRYSDTFRRAQDVEMLRLGGRGAQYLGTVDVQMAEAAELTALRRVVEPQHDLAPVRAAPRARPPTASSPWPGRPAVRPSPPRATANASCRVGTEAGHRLTVAGYLDTSHGRVSTTVTRALANASAHRWTDGENADGPDATWADEETVTTGARPAPRARHTRT